MVREEEPPKAPKRKKKSKEEIEAERKAAEEEAERLRQEEMARKEEERRRREEAEAEALQEAARNRAVELDRLQLEHEEDKEDVRQWRERLSSAVKEQDAVDEWSSFLECDARPDPASEPSLRMFLAEMDEADAADEEDMILGRGDAIGGCLRRVERVDEVTRLVEEQLAVATEEGDASAVRQAESFLRGLRSSNLQRLDRLSAWVLEHRGEFKSEARADQWEMRAVATSTGLNMGLWASLSGKQIRLGRMDLPEMKAHVGVPRQVCTSKPPVAVRLLHTRYDHASEAAKMAEEFAREHRLNPPPATPFALEQQRRTRSARARARPTGRADTPATGPDTEEGEGKEEDAEEAAAGAGESKDAEADERKDAEGEAEAGAGGGEEEGGEEDEMIARPPPTPAPVPSAMDAPRPPALETPLGGVYMVELVTLPTLGKTVKRWRIQKVSPLSTGVERRAHPLEAQGMAAALTVRVEVPPHVIVPNTVKVCFWNAVSGKWEVEPDAQVTFEEDGRSLAFKTTMMTSLALVQPRTVDLPYRGWWLRPTGDGAVRYGIRTPRFHVQFRVEGAKVTLEAPDRKELSAWRGTPMRPGPLLFALSDAGLRVMPDTSDADTEGMDVFLPPPGEEVEEGTRWIHRRRITPKDPKLVDKVYREIAHVAPAFAMESSRWNQDPQWGWVDERTHGRVGDPARLRAIESEPISEGRLACVLRAREALDPEVRPSDVHPTDWRCVYFRADEDAPSGLRVSLVRATETAAVFNASSVPGGGTHNRLLRALSPRSTPEAVRVVEEASPVLQETLFRLLRLTMPLSFA